MFAPLLSLSLSLHSAPRLSLRRPLRSALARAASLPLSPLLLPVCAARASPYIKGEPRGPWFGRVVRVSVCVPLRLRPSSFVLRPSSFVLRPSCLVRHAASRLVLPRASPRAPSVPRLSSVPRPAPRPAPRLVPRLVPRLAPRHSSLLAPRSASRLVPTAARALRSSSLPVFHLPSVSLGERYITTSYRYTGAVDSCRPRLHRALNLRRR